MSFYSNYTANPTLTNALHPANIGAAYEVETETNGKEVSMMNPYENNDTYKGLILKGLNPNVAQALCDLLVKTGTTAEEFDDRAVEMLSDFPQDQGTYIINGITAVGLYGVQNKPQYFMSVMRSFKDRVNQMGPIEAMGLQLIPSPKIEDIKAIIDRTGYELEVTVGQRKYYNPPDHPVEPKGSGHEIYIGHIPDDVFEDTLIPLFEPIGQIWSFRLILDPINGKGKGYAFLIYVDKNHANEAAKKLNNYELQPGKPLKVNVSVANTRLFIGNLPKSKTKEELLEDIRESIEGVVDLIIYTSPDGGENRKNRGFCFVDFTDHKSASDAKRRISMGKVSLWNGNLMVDWADQQNEPDEETMAKVKVLYVKNLKESITEDQIKDMFSPYGEIEKVKKVKQNYAFIHYLERDSAMKAIGALNNTEVDGVIIEVALAKPQVEGRIKKRFGGQNPMRGAFGNRGGYGYGMPPRGRGGRGGGATGYPNPYAGYGYDAAAYAAAGYAAYAGYPGYDMYGYPTANPYAAYGYGATPSTEGYFSQPYAQGSGGAKRGRGARGGKRTGDTSGGPATKREFSQDY